MCIRDRSLVRSAFFASAERGRPEHPEAVGARLALSYRGAEYRLRVDRTSPGTYRIHDGAPIDVAVDRLGEFERRISVGGRRHVVVAIEQGAAFRIEVDGIAHVVTRDDGVVVRTGWPALVAQVLVEPGQTITAGDPVAVLESMKMVSTVTAPFDGVVTSIAVMANAQVERGAPLLRIKAADGTSTAHLGDGAAERVDLTAFANAADAPAGKGADWVFERLINYLLGYDLDPARLKALTGEYQKIAAATPAGDATLLGWFDRRPPETSAGRWAPDASPDAGPGVTAVGLHARTRARETQEERKRRACSMGRIRGSGNVSAASRGLAG